MQSENWKVEKDRNRTTSTNFIAPSCQARKESFPWRSLRKSVKKESICLTLQHAIFSLHYVEILSREAGGSVRIIRFLPIKCSTERLQQSVSRQDAKTAKKNVFPPACAGTQTGFSDLGVLCVFARGILPSVVTKSVISPKFQISLVGSIIVNTKKGSKNK